MKQTLVKLTEHQDRVVQVVKGKFGLKNKNEAIQLIVDAYEEEHVEPELRPEFVAKIQDIEKEWKFKRYDSMEDFWSEIEDES